MAHELRVLQGTMRKFRFTFLFSILLTSNSALAKMPAHHQDPSTPAAKRNRDVAAEDAVAKQFETVRANAGLPQLTRIKHRTSLEQQLCTATYSTKIQSRRSDSTGAGYVTDYLGSVSPELTRIALYKERGGKNRLLYPRYSVAVWRVTEAPVDKVTYWVAVRLYWSALQEFVNYHLTDEALYPQNGWKKSIAPQCRGK
jgi:hypothetical protein